MDLGYELARVRALRADPPGLAGQTDRRRVFAAALEQFEQLLWAADASPPATAPLPLFYALSQAGRAIAAARHPDSDRWDYRGHGIQGPHGKHPIPIGQIELTPTRTARGAFRVVSEAVGSPVRGPVPMRLSALWASLPAASSVEGLGLGELGPLHGMQPERERQRPSIEVRAAADATGQLDELLGNYPALRDPSIRVVVGNHPRRLGWIKAGLFVPFGAARQLEEIAEADADVTDLYFRPAITGEPPPSILMTWWGVLFALSQLARYEPALWIDTINPDHSALAVPVEDAIRTATADLPELIYHGLTGSWAAEPAD